MTIVRHGLSVGLERVGNEFFWSLRVAGKLRHEDYEIIVPMLEAAMEGVDDPHVRVFIDATQLEGWEMRAAWDDLKLGLKHGREFSKIAIVGNSQWQALGTRIASWFISGEAKYFEDEKSAMEWLR